MCLDDEATARCGERALDRGVNVVGYGTVTHPRIPNQARITSERLEGTTTFVTVDLDGTEYEYSLVIPGRHMALNSAAALLAGHLAGADPAKLADGLSGFTGVRRRFEFRGELPSGTRVYDDYAHHPTEVAAVLSAAKAAHDRVVVCFQPHLYSRTINFAQEFADALSIADAAVVLEIFGAREAPVEGVDSRIITDKMSIEAIYDPDFSHAPLSVAELTRPGDVVITMGAGSVTMLADPLLAALAEAEK